MKHRRFTPIALVCALSLVLAACGRQAAQLPASASPQSASASASTAKETALPQDTKDGANAMQKITPPYEEKLAVEELPTCLPEDLQQLYNAAFFLMRSLMQTTGFQMDYEAEPLTMDDGLQYYPDSGFASYSAFCAALEAAFTADYATELLNESHAYVDDGNDTLYSLGAGRGADILYKNVTFALASASDTEIVVTMTGHYATSMDTNGKLSEQEQTEEYTLRLVKTDAGWRFSAFTLPF